MSDTLFALFLVLTPVDGGATVTVFAGVLTTAPLCRMAGAGIAREVQAEVPQLVVSFTCQPHVAGVDA